MKKNLSILLRGMCLLFLFWANISPAAEWYFQPSANFRTLYDDNIRLISGRLDELLDAGAFGFITSGDIKLGVNSERLNSSLNVRGTINRYISDFDLDSDNLFLDFRSGYFVTERNNLGLNADFVKDTTLTSELDTNGFIQDNIDRQLWSVNPHWTYSLSELMSVQLNYEHTDVTYGESDLVLKPFFDFTTDSASINFRHQWNPVFSYFVGFSALLYEAPDTSRSEDSVQSSTKTRDYNLTAGMDYQFSETWNGAFSFGLRRTTREFTVNDVAAENTSLGPLFSFSTEKAFETAVIIAGYIRSTSPTGTGDFVLVDRFYIDYQQQISKRFRAMLYATFNKTTRGDISLDQDSTFFHVEPKISWLITRQADLTASYRFRLRESENSDSAISNAVFLTLNYTWDKFASREF